MLVGAPVEAPGRRARFRGGVMSRHRFPGLARGLGDRVPTAPRRLSNGPSRSRCPGASSGGVAGLACCEPKAIVRRPLRCAGDPPGGVGAAPQSRDHAHGGLGPVRRILARHTAGDRGGLARMVVSGPLPAARPPTEVSCRPGTLRRPPSRPRTGNSAARWCTVARLLVRGSPTAEHDSFLCSPLPTDERRRVGLVRTGVRDSFSSSPPAALLIHNGVEDSSFVGGAF